MKLTKILEEVMTEIGDLSAGSFELTKPPVEALLLKSKDQIDQYKKRTGENIKLAKQSMYLAKGESGTEYNIYISYDVGSNDQGEYYIEGSLTFDEKKQSADTAYQDTNAREQFKLMTTVAKALEDFISQADPIAKVRKMVFSPKADVGKTFSLDSKRARLYRQYINKGLSRLPGKWEVKENPKKNQIEIYRID